MKKILVREVGQQDGIMKGIGKLVVAIRGMIHRQPHFLTGLLRHIILNKVQLLL